MVRRSLRWTAIICCGESESIFAIAEMAGEYQIEVRSTEKTAKTGRYEVKVEELRAATAEDKYRVAGETVFREAERLQNGMLEDKRKSVEKYYESLELYRKSRRPQWGGRHAQQHRRRSISLLSGGDAEGCWRNTTRALPLWRAVGDRSGEANTLNGIGVIYAVAGGDAEGSGEIQRGAATQAGGGRPPWGGRHAQQHRPGL